MYKKDKQPVSLYKPDPKRYDAMLYRKSGRSGLQLPLLSLGLWHNFGDVDPAVTARSLLRKAFDLGITHFDLANNYGPPYGSAESTFGRCLAADLKPYRDELIVSTKAGYGMWDGPYGNGGSKKYLVASLDQSLKRMGLDYVDIFYHHRPDPDTPLEETMHTLCQLVQQGKALYAGISNYNAEQTRQARKLMQEWGCPLVINQVRYSMLDRSVEKQVLPTANEEGLGIIAFSPLAQGVLTDRYLKGIPADSRAAKSWGHLQAQQITDPLRKQIKQLNDLARSRHQSLSQMAIAWLLRDERITSVLIGASSLEQLKQNYLAISNINFIDSELLEIDNILSQQHESF